MDGAFKLHCTDYEFMNALRQGNLQLAEDALALLDWSVKEGLLQKARKGVVPYGTRDFRVYTGLYALADTVFQQAGECDTKAFDLYDALLAAWPEKKPVTSPSFQAHYKAVRSLVPYAPSKHQCSVDLACYRRVQEFVRSCR